MSEATSFGKGRLAELKPYYASYPGVLVHIDCTPGSCLIKSGNSHIMAIIDSFSGHVQLYAIPVSDSRVAARALMRYISIHSMPLKIVTDNGPEFSNELMAELALLLGLKHTFVAPYNSKSNGKVENNLL